MEYLITYGLALLVILVVLGILFAVVFPMLKAPADCKFSDTTFSCDQQDRRFWSPIRATTSDSCSGWTTRARICHHQGCALHDGIPWEHQDGEFP